MSLTHSGAGTDAVAERPQGASALASITAEETPLKERRRQLARELVEGLRNGVNAMAPRAGREDVSFYLDADMFAREQLTFFRETPLVACLSTDVAEPGSYRVFDYAGIPIVVTRGSDGIVRAFLNICAHRGARVVRQECGKASRFTCRFHGWTFDSAGKAVGIPEKWQFASDMGDERHLLPCPAEERYGLVFVQATPNSTMDLDTHLGAVGPELAILELDQAVRVFGEDLPIRSNWKYALDTFFESYHLNSLHQKSVASVFSPHSVYKMFGRHHRYTFSPRVVHDWVNLPESEWPVHLVVIQYFIFPNTIISVGSTTPSGSTITMHNLFPNSLRDTTSKISFCAMHGVRSPEHKAEIEASYEKTKLVVVTEDYSVASESYNALSQLPVGTQFPVGRLEVGIHNFHRNVKDLVGLEPVQGLEVPNS